MTIAVTMRQEKKPRYTLTLRTPVHVGVAGVSEHTLVHGCHPGRSEAEGRDPLCILYKRLGGSRIALRASGMTRGGGYEGFARILDILGSATHTDPCSWRRGYRRHL